MPDLLLELFSEEIPARMQARAALDLEKRVNQHLIDAGYMPTGVKAFATPRRLTLIATGLPVAQEDIREEKKGPRVGAPEKAVEGFLRSAGLTSLDQCEQRSDKKGDYFVAIIDRKGQPTADIIAKMVPDIVRNFPWPKSMRWGAQSGQEGALKWVRPLTSILCTFNGEIVSFDVDGLPASDKTYGHRFMGPDEIQTRNFEDYEKALRRANVILDMEERKEKIAAEAKTLCEAQGLELLEDKALLEEVAGLAEWPVVMIGNFDVKFLTIPDEVLTASMRGHQKYFSVCDPKTKRLANRFIVVANIESPDGGAAMRNGYERVLTARLSDGWYLYHQDLKSPPETRIDDLGEVTFFEGLGSIGDKAKRVAKLAREIAPIVGANPDSAERAAMLAKADLVTGMVGEFPELQGVMGRYYALAQNEPQDIADAIRDHYKPQGQDDNAPSEPVSVAVSLAEKLDTLTAFWGIDKKPTGSSDPFALRRAALGVIRIILQNELRYPLPSGPTDILNFFHDRLKVYLRDKKHRHDHIDAVLKNPDGGLQDDLIIIMSRLKALENFLKTDDGTNLAAAYKRTANILKAEEKKGALPGRDAIDPGTLSEAAEKNLYATLEKAETQAAKAIEQEKFSDAMSALSGLRAPIDDFFENVIVNADEPAVRTNRLLLLMRFRDATSQIADFSKLEG